ncbi:MAG: IS21-like element helper ATPase IstB [Caldisericia bacterium]|nr:IS21-like element helper ATPase IstB [Caldisericia bacterium]
MNNSSIYSTAMILKLPYLKTHHRDLLEEAKHTNMSHEELLETFLQREHEQRKNNGIHNRMRQAKFPVKKYLEDFDRSKYPKEYGSHFDELETLDFIAKKENVILIGSPGSGKSHYVIGLAIKSIMEGKSVLFVSVPNLIIELKEAMNQRQLTWYKKKFEKYDAVVMDELGYISFDKAGAEMLFNLISNRNDKGSILVTSNLTFDRWGEVFQDTVLTGALVDRIAHKAHILDLSRETSYRYEETVTWRKKKVAHV